jgi:hypothetical protein|nr:hypothetical protein Hi04_10k_c2476_00009 [uncultured bacterium]
MGQPVLSLEEILSLIEDDIRWMANASQSFAEIAHAMPDGDEKRHIQSLAVCYRECEKNRRALIERMRRRAAAG